MMADDYQSVLANALQQLETLKSHVRATQIEQERKESLLRELQARLEELQEQKESVSQQIREVNADTAMIINELRVFEELEMLDCMLSEKNTQLFLKQNEHEALLQQLANMETALGAPRRPHKASKENYDNNDEESDWRYCCDYFLSQVESTNRYSLLQTSHLVSHPVSVFQQSVRKMYRTAREREEELAIQFNYVNTQLEQVSSLDETLRSLENNYKREVERLNDENQERVETMNKVAATETLKLRKELKKVVDAHHDLMKGLKARGILHVDGILLSTPLANVRDAVFSKSTNRINVPLYDSTNDNSEDTCKSELRSAVVLQQSHLRKKNVDLNSTKTVPVISPLPSNNDDDSNNNSNINTYNEVNRPIGIDANSTSSILDPEIEELMSQVAAAERDAHRLEQGYETLMEEAIRSRSEDETRRRDMEARLSAAKDVLSMLQKEKSEWESLQKQMSLLLQ
ncbi:hypothetical protein LSM04_002432 [Trypanosoma melophagium]|uniref:uncharacterized protein n=1 Tax=Trypanosoma melophagium TaxID=715481 RepID=UPI00351A8919|nr:hypothetical protein LSM04_002432 [Trypanosoma melophagium]